MDWRDYCYTSCCATHEMMMKTIGMVQPGNKSLFVQQKLNVLILKAEVRRALQFDLVPHRRVPYKKNNFITILFVNNLLYFFIIVYTNSFPKKILHCVANLKKKFRIKIEEIIVHIKKDCFQYFLFYYISFIIYFLLYIYIYIILSKVMKQNWFS